MDGVRGRRSILINIWIASIASMIYLIWTQSTAVERFDPGHSEKWRFNVTCCTVKMYWTK